PNMSIDIPITIIAKRLRNNLYNVQRIERNVLVIDWPTTSTYSMMTGQDLIRNRLNELINIDKVCESKKMAEQGRVSLLNMNSTNTNTNGRTKKNNSNINSSSINTTTNKSL